MSRTDYDIVIVGGGLGGAAFAVVMAKIGARVLVVERETRFQDRVRGEFMEPWGVAETHGLGIYDAIRSAANDNPFWQIHIGEMKLLSLLEIPSEPQFEQERALPMNWCKK